MTKYKNKISGKDSIKKGDYVDTPEVNQLKTTLSSLESLLGDVITESKKKRYSKSQRERLGEILSEHEIEKTKLKHSLRELIEYYKENLKDMKGIYGKIRKEENVEFLNNLVDYERSDLLTLVVIYLSALPELKQITDNQVYLNYLALKKMTLVKLLYLSMIRTSPVFVPIINHYYNNIENIYNENEIENKEKEINIENKSKEQKEKEKEDRLFREILEIIRKYNEENKNKENNKEIKEQEKEENKQKMNKEEEIDEENKENKPKEKEDILVFEVDELHNLVDTNVSNNKLLRKKKMKIDNEVKEIIIMGTERNDEVIRSILRHPPHFKILLELLNRNEYRNEVIKENIEYLNNNKEENITFMMDYNKEENKKQKEIQEIKEENKNKKEEEEQEKKKETKKIIRNKKVEVILSLMNKEELENTYRQFLQYIYPFNSLYKDSRKEEENEEDIEVHNKEIKETQNKEKQEIKEEEIDEELLGDENIEIVQDNRLLTMIKENMSLNNIMEIVEKYSESITKDREGSIRGKIITFLSSKFGIFNEKDNKKENEGEIEIQNKEDEMDDKNKINKEIKEKEEEEVNEEDKRMLELLEMKDEELDKELDKYIEELERDPKTLRIKVCDTPLKYRSRRENVFNILPRLTDKREEDKEYRNTKLYAKKDENITFMMDYNKEEDIEIENKEENNKENENEEEETQNEEKRNEDKFENLIENDKEEEEYYDRSKIKRNREKKFIRYMSIIGNKEQKYRDKEDYKNKNKKEENKIEKMEFDKKVMESWMRLGLTSSMANSAMSYLTSVYSNNKENEQNREYKKENEQDIISNKEKEKETEYVDKINKVKEENEKKKLYFGKEFNMRPTLIQMLGVPEILKKKNKKNLIICGGVGSGKTLSYLLPILQNLKEDEKRKLRVPSSPRCLIVVPTTELCDQICRTVKGLGHLVKVSTVAMCKGRERSKIREKMKGLVDVLITTPSRLHRYRKYFKLSRLKYLVIEEADCLLNEGFFPKIYSILQQLPNYGSSGKGINEESTSRRKVEGDLPVQIIQVASTINYLKFFESIHESFNKFINKQNIINERHTKKSKKIKKENKNKEKEKEEKEEDIENEIEIQNKEENIENKTKEDKEKEDEIDDKKRKEIQDKIKELIDNYKQEKNKNKEMKEDKNVFKVNLMKLFGKHKIRLELYRHILEYYFAPLDKNQNSFKYDRRIIEDLVNSHKIIDEIGITRPSKGIKHMFIGSGQDKVRTLINLLKYDLKYPTRSINDKYMRKYKEIDNKENKKENNEEIKEIQNIDNKNIEMINEDRKIIIFCKTVKAVRAVDHYLTESGYEPISIHSEMPFRMRRRNFEMFNRNRSGILVTTELLSRGLDLKVDNVILFDFPRNPNEYIRKSSILRHLPAYVISECELDNTKNNKIMEDKLDGVDEEIIERYNNEENKNKKEKEIQNKEKEDYKNNRGNEQEMINRLYLSNLEIESNETRLEWEKRRQKVCISLIDKKDEVLSEAIKRSLRVEYFPLNKLSSRKKDYNQITGRFKYLTQAGGYYKFLSYLRELQIKDVFNPLELYKYLDEFREIVKEQFVNSFKKVKLRRIRICKKRRELMRKLKMLKKWNKAIRLKQRIISDIDKKKKEKDYIYVNLTKDQRSCPPMKNLKKVRYELLKLKLLEGSNSEKLLKRSENQILKFINTLQNKLVQHNHIVSELVEKYGLNKEEDNKEINEKEEKESVNYLKLIDKVKDKLEYIKSDNKNKEIRRICSLV